MSGITQKTIENLKTQISQRQHEILTKTYILAIQSTINAKCPSIPSLPPFIKDSTVIRYDAITSYVNQLTPDYL